MSKEKTLDRVLSGQSYSNINFSDLKKINVRFRLHKKDKRRSFIYTKENICEIINIQPLNNKSKSYQVKQVRNIILKYKLKV